MPAPAPTTTDAPAKPSKPDSSNPTSRPGLDDAFSAIDALAAQDEPKPDKAPKAPEIDDDDVQIDDPKPDAAPVKKPDDKAQAKPDVSTDEKPKKLRVEELRSEYETLKKKHADLEKQLKEREQPKPDDEWRTKITEAEKRAEELERRLQETRYEESEDYKTKYEAPISRAFKAAYKDIGDLTVVDSDGKERTGKPEDFIALMHLNTRDAASKAKEMFGDAAAEVLAHRRMILNLTEAKQDAVEQWKKDGANRQKEAAARAESAWKQTTEELPTKYAKFFAPEEGDDEGNTALKEGRQLVDYAFSNPNIPPEDASKMFAMVAWRAAAWGREVIRNQRMSKKVAELEKELAGFKESDPGKGGSDGDAQVAKDMKNWENHLESLAEAPRS